MALMNGYKNRFTTVYNFRVSDLKQTDWKPIFICVADRSGWLEYSLKRSLGIECTDVQEQQLGTAQVTDTINEARRFADMIPELENWLINDM